MFKYFLCVKSSQYQCLQNSIEHRQSLTYVGSSSTCVWCYIKTKTTRDIYDKVT